MRVHASTGSRVAWFRALHVLAAICVMLAGFILDLPKNGPTIEVIRVSAAALAIVIAIISKLLNDRLSGTRFALLIIGWLTSLVSMWTIQVPSNLVAIEPMMWASPGGVTAGFWIVEPIARSLRRRRVDRGRRRYWAVWVPTSEEAQEEYEVWAMGKPKVIRAPNRKGDRDQ